MGKGKPVAGVVEAVLNGSMLRLTLLPDRMPATVAVAGVQCPAMGKRAPAPATAAAAPESNGTASAAPESNGTATTGAATVTAASIAAAAGAGAPQPAAGGPEPLAREAKWFAESRALGREVRVVLEGVDKYNNLIGSVFYPDGDKPASLAEGLAAAGLARAAEWSLALMTNGAMRLREAERSAKQAKRGLWLNYVPQVRGTTGCSAD